MELRGDRDKVGVLPQDLATSHKLKSKKKKKRGIDYSRKGKVRQSVEEDVDAVGGERHESLPVNLRECNLAGIFVRCLGRGGEGGPECGGLVMVVLTNRGKGRACVCVCICVCTCMLVFAYLDSGREAASHRAPESIIVTGIAK